MVEIFDDIRKIYLFDPPCEELADHIEFFSESSGEATRQHMGDSPFTVKMFPSWTPTFWFNLGPEYKLKMNDQLHVISPQRDILLIRNSVTERINQPSDHIFTIKFFPGALETVLDIDQSMLKNKIADAGDILPSSLIGQVKVQNNFGERKRIIQNFFLDQLQKKKSRDHYVRFVKDTIACYEKGELRYNVDELAARLFATSKTINRYFNRVIGTSPKHYFSILRARTAMSAWVADKKNFQPTKFGYYDLSHFYKERNQFTSMGPRSHK